MLAGLAFRVERLADVFRDARLQLLEVFHGLVDLAALFGSAAFQDVDIAIAHACILDASVCSQTLSSCRTRMVFSGLRLAFVIAFLPIMARIRPRMPYSTATAPNAMARAQGLPASSTTMAATIAPVRANHAVKRNTRPMMMLGSAALKAVAFWLISSCSNCRRVETKVLNSFLQS